MSEQLIYTLIGMGFLVCLGLIVYISRQHSSLKAAKAGQADRLRQLEVKAQEQRDYLINSIHVIAGAMVNDEKMTLTEGSIRISVLLDSLAPQLKQDPEISVISTVYEKTKHIPFLKAWKELDKQDKWRYLQEMKRVESEHESDLLKAAQVLSKYPFEQHFH